MMNEHSSSVIIVAIIAIVAIFALVTVSQRKAMPIQMMPQMMSAQPAANTMMDTAGQAMKSSARQSAKASGPSGVFAQIVASSPTPDTEKLRQMFSSISPTSSTSIASVFSQKGVFVSETELGRMFS